MSLTVCIHVANLAVSDLSLVIGDRLRLIQEFNSWTRRGVLPVSNVWLLIRYLKVF